MTRFPGTTGYDAEAADLAVRYEAIAFDEAQRPILHLLPDPPARILELGAGTGRDAAHLAALGHQVVAVEPSPGMMRIARDLHPSPGIEWIEDGLPDLQSLQGREAAFDLVLATAVWMHLDEAERRRAMRVVAQLLRPGGLFILSLRHGPVPAGRRMFEVSGEETLALAAEFGLSPVLNIHTGSLQRLNWLADVTWTRLALRRA